MKPYRWQTLDRHELVAKWPWVRLSVERVQLPNGKIIDDCVTGIYKLMRSDYHEPLNLGQDRLVTINQLANIIADVAGVEIVKKHIPGPEGVHGRNSDDTRLRQVLGWELEILLEEGSASTYAWIEGQVKAKLESALDNNLVATAMARSQKS